MKTLLKGEVHFVENYHSWIVEVTVKWNRRIITILINSRKTDLETEFLDCSLTKAPLFTFLSRSETYNFSGKKSPFSELLLESIETQCLMDSKNPKIELEGKSFIFKGGIRKKDVTSLSNVFKLYEMLLNEIDYLHHENLTS
ncbi:hypothetical protein JBL43_12650 [Aureibaculum sp. A20]|uniref:Uncharacterized protein n=1 Tax=Aureibaculum flavum TaxID=2795986 RepID=A0ABS0WSX4_9FLAO|nr:hypothetical protein [Aureibaculum flavum]MBJ2175094.1 hypothetical protein [Aureibaculum flavum]